MKTWQGERSFDRLKHCLVERGASKVDTVARVSCVRSWPPLKTLYVGQSEVPSVWSGRRQAPRRQTRAQPAARAVARFTSPLPLREAAAALGCD